MPTLSGGFGSQPHPLCTHYVYIGGPERERFLFGQTYFYSTRFEITISFERTPMQVEKSTGGSLYGPLQRSFRGTTIGLVTGKKSPVKNPQKKTPQCTKYLIKNDRKTNLSSLYDGVR